MKTRKSFYRAFRKIAGKFYWEGLTGNRDIRGWSMGKCFCPITAVHYIRSGEYVHPMDFQTGAASKLGLPNNEANVIANGADGLTLSDNKNKRARFALLRAIQETRS